MPVTKPNRANVFTTIGEFFTLATCRTPIFSPGNGSWPFFRRCRHPVKRWPFANTQIAPKTKKANPTMKSRLPISINDWPKTFIINAINSPAATVPVVALFQFFIESQSFAESHWGNLLMTNLLRCRNVWPRTDNSEAPLSTRPKPRVVYLTTLMLIVWPSLATLLIYKKNSSQRPALLKFFLSFIVRDSGNGSWTTGWLAGFR